MTLATKFVLRALLDDPAGEHYGRQVSIATGLAAGIVHQILNRLQAQGWLWSRWEDVDPAVVGRPRRHYFAFTDEGARAAADAVATLRR